MTWVIIVVIVLGGLYLVGRKGRNEAAPPKATQPLLKSSSQARGRQ